MLKTSLTLILFLSLTSCAWLGDVIGDQHAHEHGSARTSEAEERGLSNSEACAELLANEHPVAPGALNGRYIRLLNWNTQKHAHHLLHDDLTRFGAEADLILLQEAVVDTDHLKTEAGGFFWNFAPGYIKDTTATGVVTASRVAPLGYCKLISVEPWLGSPKATSITRYALDGRDDTLLVVNIHIINFTLTTEAMKDQLNDALVYISRHTGPVIMAGDFNTWSDDRKETLDSAMQTVGLTDVRLTKDGRTRIFGHTVDHIFVRGMEHAAAKTYTIESSDHNPITALLSIQ